MIHPGWIGVFMLRLWWLRCSIRCREMILFTPSITSVCIMLWILVGCTSVSSTVSKFTARSIEFDSRGGTASFCWRVMMNGDDAPASLYVKEINRTRSLSHDKKFEKNTKTPFFHKTCVFFVCFLWATKCRKNTRHSTKHSFLCFFEDYSCIGITLMLLFNQPSAFCSSSSPTLPFSSTP